MRRSWSFILTLTLTSFLGAVRGDKSVLELGIGMWLGRELSKASIAQRGWEFVVVIRDS
jgi:hypothetical protein